MKRRAFRNFITKRSSIWTLSLCLTGALALGGIALVDNSLRGDEEQQIENEIDDMAYLGTDMEDTTGIEMDNGEEDTAEASGNAVEEIAGTGLEGSDLIQDEVAGTGDTVSEMADAQISDGTGVVDETISEISEASDGAIADTAEVLNGTVSGADISAAGMADVSEAASSQVISEQALLDAGIGFSEESALLWPSAGTILIDYSMDSSVYFTTLNQYKYNPALIIGSEVGNQVLASAKGIVEAIQVDEETGTTLLLNIGNGYKLTYGQLKELAVAEGDIVESGTLLGYVSEPTKYFVEEGSNLYFGMTYEDEAVDPVLYLEG